MTATTTSEIYYDPHQRDVMFNPHPLFRRMREEAPLYYNEVLDFYALTRFDDVERAHVDRDTFISSRGGTLDILKANIEIPPGTVIFEDPPTHTVHRSLLSRMFTGRRVAELEGQIRQLCADLLDPHVGAGGFDVMTDFGKLVPMRVIGMLVGIPEGDQEAIRDHVDAAHKASGDADHPTDLGGALFADYVDWRADHPSDDIMTQLLEVEFEDENGVRRRLRREELLAYVSLVAAAGDETTRLTIGWMAKLLGEHPDQRRLLVEDPGLAPGAVEETLRFEPPPLQSARYVARDIELHGQVVPAGSIMALVICAANRDESRYPDPDRFDIRRDQGAHLTFGFGSHYCLGQALARVEARIALEELVRRFPDWELDEDNLEFLQLGGDLRGWERLPVLVP